MKLTLIVGLMSAGLLAAGLSGCAALSAFNSALIPTLKPIDARIHTDLGCSDLATAVLAAAPTITASGAIAVMAACERRDQSQTLSIDPQGARKVLDQAIGKSPTGVAAGALVGGPTP